MKKHIWFVLALTALVIFAASTLYAGYSRENGSRTWTGPGNPPHWSPDAARPQNKSVKPPQPVTPGKPDIRIRPPQGSGSKGGYWRDKLNRWNYHRNRRSGYMYYTQPRVETIIIEREKKLPAYTPIRQKPSRVQCGGKTITRTNSKTGEITIEYVTGAQNCQ